MIRTLLTALTLLCAGPALAQQQGEFDLPAAPTPAPTGSGQVQGPVDDSGIIPIGPRVIGPAATPTTTPTTTPTAAPTAVPSTAPTAAPTAARTSAPTPTPRTSPSTAARPAPATAQRAPANRPTATRTPDLRLVPPVGAAPTQATSQNGPSITDPIVSADGIATGSAETANDASPFAATPTPVTPGPVEAQSGLADPGIPFWWWMIAALAAVGALAAAFFAIRRQQAATPIVVAAKASPGLMPAAAAPKPTPEPEGAAKEMPAPTFVNAAVPAQTVPSSKPSPAASRPIAPLGLETQVTRMQRSMRAITVTARVAVTNRGLEPIANAVIQGDLVGASKGKPLGEQLANASAEMDELEELGTLAPGERRETTIQVRRELPEIEGIRQGTAIVFIPLLRIRFAGDGATPLASTVLVGHPPERSGGKPTPFLADAPPQNYNDVVGRALG